METLYVTDLDGTLLNRQDRISEFSCRTINRLVEEGMRFTYATARSLSSALVVTEGLKVKTPIIAYNGAFLFWPDTGEVLHSVRFSKEEVDDIKAELENRNFPVLVYSVIDGAERVSWDSRKWNEGLERYASLRKGDARLRPLEDGRGLYDGDIFYFTCIDTREELLPVYDRFREDERCNCTLQQELYRPEFFCEIMPGQATKANAILRLKEMLRCDRVVSFGDAVNDIPMFRISDECYAVENAVEELKALATGIIPANEQDGVARWLLENRRKEVLDKSTHDGLYSTI